MDELLIYLPLKQTTDQYLPAISQMHKLEHYCFVGEMCWTVVPIKADKLAVSLECGFE